MCKYNNAFAGLLFAQTAKLAINILYCNAKSCIHLAHYVHMSLCSIHVQSESTLISQTTPAAPKGPAPCSLLQGNLKVNLCESQCVVESQARGSEQERGVWTVDQRRPRQEVALPDGNIACYYNSIMTLNTPRYQCA